MTQEGRAAHSNKEEALKTIPESYRDILSGKSFAHLSTIMEDGSPQASPVWIDMQGDNLLVNSAAGRLKDRNMRRDPNVALSITDPDNPYRCLMIRGRVVEVTTEGADAHIDAMARKYMGVEAYPFRKPGEERVLYVIETVSVSTMG